MSLLNKLFMSTKVDTKGFVDCIQGKINEPIYSLADVYKDGKLISRELTVARFIYDMKDVVRNTKNFKNGTHPDARHFKNFRCMFRKNFVFAEYSIEYNAYYQKIEKQYQREILMTRETAIKLGLIKVT